MITVGDVKYMSLGDYLGMKGNSDEKHYERLLDDLCGLKSMCWHFLGEEGDKILSQFRSRLENAGGVMNVAYTERDELGLIAYISPLIVDVDGGAVANGKWFEDPVFDSHGKLTGNGMYDTHTPGGNVLVCPEISSNLDLGEKHNIKGVGRNLVRFTFFRNYGNESLKRFCAYTRNFEPTLNFHGKVGAEWRRTVKGANTMDSAAGGDCVIVEYDRNAVSKQINKLFDKIDGNKGELMELP